MKLKLLYIIPYYLPDVSFGGPVFSVSALCESLVAQGVAVTVYTIGYDKSETYPQVVKLNGVEVHYFRGDKGKPCQISRQLWASLQKNVDNFQYPRP